MSGNRLVLDWHPPGPVAARFMADRSQVSIINGPIGSGKTTTATMKLIRLAQEQRPSAGYTTIGPNGRRLPTRRFRVAIVRDTYRQLWRTTIPSWFARIPRSVGSFTGAEGAPAVHQVPFVLADDTIVEFQADFVAIGDQAVEEVLRGYEVTCFYLNEMDLLPAEVAAYARTRTGRFPPQSEGGPSWDGIIGDLNAPELNNWTYRQYFTRGADELAAAGAALFRQPSGLSARAENLANLKPHYYRDAARDQPEWLVKRMIENVPGYSRAGKPVYPEFNDALHVARDALPAHPAFSLQIGLDAGGHPAAVFGQRFPSGRWHIIGELTGEPGTGAIRFGDLLAQVLREDYPDCRDIIGYADPSAEYGADTVAGEMNWIEIVAARTGIRIRPAPTNDPTARWEAVRLPLTRLIEGRPGFVLSPRCTRLRAGFNAEYRFRRIQGTEDRYDDRAEKNSASHPHDALQYLCSAGGEDQAIRERRGEDRKRVGRMPRQAASWNPYGG